VNAGARWVLAALALWLPACGLRGAGQDRSPSAGVPVSRDGVSVVTGQVTKKGAPPPHEVTLRYPRIAYPQRRGVEAAVNSTLRREVEAVAAGFVADLDQGPGPGSPGSDEAPPSTLEGTYETVLLDEETASFRLVFSRYLSGAAHPSGHLLTFTFDLASGKRYRLEDLFDPGSPYLEQLSEECRTRLAAKLGADADRRSIEEGTAPRTESFAGWALSKHALEIAFAEYQVGAYALGMPRCDIPRDSLRDLAARDGPLTP
jgi:hypothetical protein